MMNIFDHKSGKKLTKTQFAIVRFLHGAKMWGMRSLLLIPFLFWAGIVYIVIHFICKYW